MKSFKVFLLVLITSAIIIMLGSIAFAYWIRPSYFSSFFDNLLNTKVDSSNLDYTQDEQSEYMLKYTKIDTNLYLIEVPYISTPKYIFDKNLDNLDSLLAKNPEYLAGINAQFFDTFNNPIGYLEIDGEKFYAVSRNNIQATHIVSWLDNQINIYSSVDSSLPQKSDIAFQTGPLIVDKGVLQTNFIANSINGSGSYRRAFFGFTESGKMFMGIYTANIDLESLGERLITHYSSDVISLINLDGGSSIALQSAENSSFDIGKTKRLPMFILFK